MSFETLQQETTSYKITLVEIDEPVNIDTFINYEAGIWFKQFYKSQNAVSTDIFPRSYYYENQDTTRYLNIKSLKIGVEDYTLVGSVSAMRSQEKSFYFDVTTQIIYIRFIDEEPPLDKIVNLGSVVGFANKTDLSGNSAYEVGTGNFLIYDVKINKIPSLTNSQDPFTFGLLKYQSTTIEFDNTDGVFDDFKDRNLNRQNVRVLFGFDSLDYTDFRGMNEGFVDDITWNWSTFTLNVRDKRKNLSKQIPDKILSQNTYPYLKDENNNKEIPIAYNTVLGAKTYCLDETSVPTNNTFLFMDTTYNNATSIQAVYRKVSDVVEDITASVINTDLTAGTFELPHSTAFDTSASPDSLYDITIDFTGAIFSNALDIISDIILNYDDTSFIDTNYNTGEWTAEKLNALECSLYSEKPKEISKLIEKLLLSTNGNFFIQDDGKRTTRIYDANRTIRRVINDEEWLSDPAFNQPDSKFLSSAVVHYNQNQSDTKIFDQYTNLNYEDAALSKYKAYEQKTYKTYLTNETDVIEFSNRLLSRASNITEEVTRNLPFTHLDLKFMDFIVCNHARNYESADWKVYEIISITKDPIEGNVSLKMKTIRDYTFPDYHQGFMFGNVMFGHRFFGATVSREAS